MERPTLSRERSGPHDADDLEPDLVDAPGVIDFGAVRVPVPERGTITVEPGENGRMQAVHISLPEGRLSVSALAAPKSSRLWPDLATEIDASLREGGARVRSFRGEWGRELHATSGEATSVFVGVDGARWMLYGVATGPTRDAAPLLEGLRTMMRGTVVVRGRSPYPVRTVLPLEPPGHLAGGDPDPDPTVVVRAGAPAAGSPRGGGTAPHSAAGPDGAPAPARGVHPDAGPNLPADVTRSPDDPPTDVWPDGLLPGSRPRGALRPVTPYGGGPGRGPERPAPAPSGRPRPGSAPLSPSTPGPDVLRRGRHAAVESPNGWSGGPAPRPGPVDAHRPHDAVEPITEPLPILSPPARPGGRHRRPD